MTLASMQLLKGQHEVISISDVRQRPGDVFSQVQMGKRFSITKKGKVIAEIIPTKTSK